LESNIKHTDQRIVETLKKNYMPYAMSVIISRAIPEIDGLKPSHRKLLYTMYKMGLIKGNRTKSSNVVGQTMRLNPHGDMAIYETLVRLARGNEALLHPYIDSKGNFGKQYSKEMKYAAPRYTEVKLSKICEELFTGLEKNTVDFVDNYDSTAKEPLLLPVRFPTLLTNPNQGIAVGMACNICSFNLRELNNAICAYLIDPGIDFLDYIKAPDFSTGGLLIFNEETIRDIYNTGKGTFKLRAKYNFDKKNGTVEILEIPYTTTIEAIIDSIIDSVKKGKIKEITDIRDETDLKGLKITFDVKKSTDIESLMNKLYKLTPLEDSFSCNFTVLLEGKPKLCGLKEIIDSWIDFRIGCIKRETEFDIKRLSNRLHLLTGLKKILLDIDKAVAIVRGTQLDKEVIPNLMDGFNIDRIQAEFIAEIKLRNLNKEYIIQKTNEIKALKDEIGRLKELLRSEEKIVLKITDQLNEISEKYGQDRKTEIIEEHHIEEITEEHFIEDYNVKFFLTAHDYIKKIPLVSLRSNPEQKLKDDDKMIQEVEGSNKMDLLLFSSKHIVYKMKAHELNDEKASSLGIYLNNILEMDNDESILYIVPTEDYKGNMLFSFENGKIAKVTLKSYATKTNRKQLANAYSDKSKLVDIRFITEDIELVVSSNIKKFLVFSTSSIAEKTTRSSQGVQVLKSKKGSIMTKVATPEEAMLTDPDYYKTKNIPAVGAFLKKEDEEKKQIKIEDLT
jgi:DNA gyrase subunit A